MKNIILLALFLSFTSQAEVLIKHEKNSYQVQVVGEDREALKSVINFEKTAVHLKKDHLKIFEMDLDSSSPSFGTFFYGELDNSILSNPDSPYQRITLKDGRIKTRLSVNTHDVEWVGNFYSSFHVPSTPREYNKHDKVWVSSDHQLRITCTHFDPFMVSPYNCSFSIIQAAN